MLKGYEIVRQWWLHLLFASWKIAPGLELDPDRFQKDENIWDLVHESDFQHIREDVREWFWTGDVRQLAKSSRNAVTNLLFNVKMEVNPALQAQMIPEIELLKQRSSDEVGVALKAHEEWDARRNRQKVQDQEWAVDEEMAQYTTPARPIFAAVAKVVTAEWVEHHIEKICKER